jgi:hypothetical protein
VPGLGLESVSGTDARRGRTGGSRYQRLRRGRESSGLVALLCRLGQAAVLGCDASEPGQRDGGAPAEFWMLGCKRKWAKSEEG